MTDVDLNGRNKEWRWGNYHFHTFALVSSSWFILSFYLSLHHSLSLLWWLSIALPFLFFLYLYFSFPSIPQVSYRRLLAWRTIRSGDDGAYDARINWEESSWTGQPSPSDILSLAKLVRDPESAGESLHGIWSVAWLCSTGSTGQGVFDTIGPERVAFSEKETIPVLWDLSPLLDGRCEHLSNSRCCLMSGDFWTSDTSNVLV